MNFYILEIFVTIIITIIIVILHNFKKLAYMKEFLIGLGIIFVLAIASTFLLERPILEITNEQLNIEVKQNENIVLPKTTYHFKDVTNTVKVVSNINFNKVGQYKVKYEVPTITGIYSVIKIVNVVDTTAPKIILNGEQTYLQSYAREYIEAGCTVIDNYDENLTEKVQVNKETINENEYNIIYTVKDSSGNQATEIRKVHIIDDVAPVITINGYENMRILVNSIYEEKGATAYDEKDGDLTQRIETVENVDTSKIGTYTIAYKVKDNSGNEATKTRVVQVYQQITGSQDEKVGVIYLTFDDGPTTSSTPKILDILKEKNVKATFFILNYDASGEALIKREIAEGHTVGIHGYSHSYNTIYQSVNAYMDNITKLQEKIKQSTGYNATITRFPGGSSNTVSKFNPGIMTTLSKEVVARGYRYFDWNVSSGDAGGAKNSKDVYNNVIKDLSKNRANIVLMHDFSGNNKTIDALADIIDYGLNNGYIFSNITENTPMITHRINN